SFIDRGEMVPDEIIFELIEKDLSCENIIFDGLPRNIRQAETLDDILAKRGEKLDATVLMSVPETELIKRLTARRVCGECWENYNLITKPPKTEGRCDICGGVLYQREDDTEETVRHRLEVYHRETEPLIDFYSKKGKMVIISGAGDPDTIYAELKRALGL
ncbi:MAG: adenylate kinase family protein, partial [Candidatus Hydrothermia bacterium]